MRPSRIYFLLFTALLIVEILIALYAHDTFVRPFVGDMLVVILVYCFAMFWVSLFRIKISKSWIALGVLVFAFSVEFAQLLNVLDILKLRDYKVARIILGTSFDWKDLVAYSVGFLVVRFTDR